MKKVDILADYVEARIKLTQDMEAAVCDTDIYVCNLHNVDRSIHLHTGISILAKEACSNLYKRRHDDNFEAYFFAYRDIEFFQLEKNGEEPR